MSVPLPKEVIDRDAALDAAVSRSQEELARLRWHWTLDESNPGRVSFREYAHQVHRHNTVIRKMANGYAAWIEKQSAGDIASTRTLSDEIEVAHFGTIKTVAVESLAKELGTNISNIAANQRDTVKNLIADAQEAADRRGTTVEEEIPRKASQVAQSRRANEKRAERKQKMDKGLVLLQLEGPLTTAHRNLRRALEVARGAALDGDFVAELSDLLNDIRSVLDLLDLAVAGRADIDWDEELANLTEVK